MPVQTLSVDTADAPGRRAAQPALAFRNHDREGLTAVSVTITNDSLEYRGAFHTASVRNRSISC